MKKLVLTTLMFCLGLNIAVAEEIKIFELTGSAVWQRSKATSVFEVNPELGRAWVKTTVSEWGMDEEMDEDVYRTKVEGLSYNDATGAITLLRDGREVTCANRRMAGFLGKYPVIKNTPDCSFISRFDRVSVDDGFYVRQGRRLQVFLNVL